MLYCFGLSLIIAIGFLAIRRITEGRLNIILEALLATLLGFGIVGTTAFYVHIVLNQFNHWMPSGIVIAGIVCLFFTDKKKQNIKKIKANPPIKTFACTQASMGGGDRFLFTQNHLIGLIVLGLLAIPLTLSALHYPLGGWDAWSCWGLKAKFIFMGRENWKDVLDPILWRSNTQYPLLWPLINVWFWDLGGNFDQAVPMFNCIIIALLTAGILLFGLLELTGNLWIAVPAALLVTALPFNMILFISQYSDALLGLFLLSAFLCLLLAEKHKLPKLKILSLIFLALMSFTKNEGLIAAAIAALGIFWHGRAHKKDLKPMISAFFIALLPTIIFTLLVAPKNVAFINGLTSTEKPTNLSRMIIIAVYPWIEFISGKWNGFWLLVFGGILLAGKKIWQSTLGLIAISLILYLSVVMAYYAVNTFFEIGWWLQTTMSRILFALIPTITLWVALGLAT